MVSFAINSYKLVYSKALHKSSVNDLSGQTREIVKRKSELYGNIEREFRRVFPAMKMVIKVTDSTLQNQDPKQKYGVCKSSLIDLEAEVH